MLIQPLTTLLLIPFLGFIGSLFMPKKNERAIFSLAIAAMLVEFVLFLSFCYRWISTGASSVFANAVSFDLGHNYVLSLDLYFDKLTAVFLGMAAIMTILVFIFSKYYIHREQGFKRFYSTVLLFFAGLSLIILAGNLEVLFLGWECIGISSVLLIAFYRDRFLPARNALKVFSIYRIGDACLLAAIWYAHDIFGKSVNFSELSNVAVQHGSSIVILGLLLLMVAMVKSAQFPFSYWLPRAMEGPTTSSAIFYGALSVHMGLFLLLRTYALWEGSIWVRISIAVVGLVTAIVATSIARVQSSAKTQIAYASITQIGVMFIELAAGLQWLVLLHFVSNAALRAYQLLISPSVVSYLIHDQFFYFVPPLQKIKDSFLGKLHATFYVLGIKEWNMNTAITHYLWKPLKSIGRAFTFLDSLPVQVISLIIFLISLKITSSITMSGNLLLTISTIAAVISVIFYIRAYTTKDTAETCWNLILLGHLFGALFLTLASVEDWKYFIVDGIGVTVAFIIGYVCLRYLETRGESNTLREYQGSVYVFPKLGSFFFVIALLFMAFPIGPTFLIQDVLVSLIPASHAFQIVLFCLSYLLVGVSVMRLYTKVFFGPHKTSHHEAAYKSS